MLAGRSVTATRGEPLPLDEDGLPLQTRLRSGAESTALNVVAILRETWEDFRNADRYFKFKAGILAAWAVLSAWERMRVWSGSPSSSSSIGSLRVALTVRPASIAAWWGGKFRPGGRMRPRSSLHETKAATRPVRPQPPVL